MCAPNTNMEGAVSQLNIYRNRDAQLTGEVLRILTKDARMTTLRRVLYTGYLVQVCTTLILHLKGLSHAYL